nr:MAG TPA: hypothetical protein [Caudoviricetes sp.]
MLDISIYMYYNIIKLRDKQEVGMRDNFKLLQ